MKKLYTAFMAIVLLCSLTVHGQVTVSPSPLEEDSKNVVLTYSASSSLGNNGLKGLPSSEFVYAHIGVITTLSKDNTDWRHVLTEWPTAAMHRR